MSPTAIRNSSPPGVCCSCGCTDDRACEGGCAWANRARTICTTCADREVTVGQVWQDMDPRQAVGQRRTLRILHVGTYYATCDSTTEFADGVRPRRSREVTIRLERFRPRRNGYRLLTPNERGHS